MDYTELHDIPIIMSDKQGIQILIKVTKRRKKEILSKPLLFFVWNRNHLMHLQRVDHPENWLNIEIFVKLE